MSTIPYHRQLPAALIFEIARQGGVDVPDGGAKRPIRCPFHEDRTPSAVLFSANVFHCSSCDLNLSAKQFAELLRVAWPPESLRSACRASSGARSPAEVTTSGENSRNELPPLTQEQVAAVWGLALAGARADEVFEVDREAYDYLSARGLAEAWDQSLYGVLSWRAELPAQIAWWVPAGYRILCPLYDELGALTNIQARACCDVAPKPKTMLPRGLRARGTLFSNEAGLRLLRGAWGGSRTVILAEGLTDFLALSIACMTPVLSAPGTGMARSAAGSWAAGCEVYLAVDNDEAGDNAIRPLGRTLLGAGARRVLRVRWPGRVKDACDCLQALGLPRFVDLIQDMIHGRHGLEKHNA